MSALQKISSQMTLIPQQDLREVEGMNAFFIIPAKAKSVAAELFATHPPLEKRLAALAEIARRDGPPGQPLDLSANHGVPRRSIQTEVEVSKSACQCSVQTSEASVRRRASHPSAIVRLVRLPCIRYLPADAIAAPSSAQISETTATELGPARASVPVPRASASSRYGARAAGSGSDVLLKPVRDHSER